jgi:hypothetical protein
MKNPVRAGWPSRAACIHTIAVFVLVATAVPPARAEVSEFPNGHPAFVSDVDADVVPSTPVPDRDLERIAGSRTDNPTAGTAVGRVLLRRYGYALAQCRPIAVVVAVVATVATWVKIDRELQGGAR